MPCGAGLAGAVRSWDLGKSTCVIEANEGLGGAVVWCGAQARNPSLLLPSGRANRGCASGFFFLHKDCSPLSFFFSIALIRLTKGCFHVSCTCMQVSKTLARFACDQRQTRMMIQKVVLLMCPTLPPVHGRNYLDITPVHLIRKKPHTQNATAKSRCLWGCLVSQK